MMSSQVADSRLHWAKSSLCWVNEHSSCLQRKQCETHTVHAPAPPHSIQRRGNASLDSCLFSASDLDFRWCRASKTQQ